MGSLCNTVGKIEISVNVTKSKNHKRDIFVP